MLIRSSSYLSRWPGFWSLCRRPKRCTQEILSFELLLFADSGLRRTPVPTRMGPRGLKDSGKRPRLSSKESVEFGLQRGGRVLLGDEMGLGKTLQAPSKRRTSCLFFTLVEGSRSLLPTKALLLAAQYEAIFISVSMIVVITLRFLNCDH